MIDKLIGPISDIVGKLIPDKDLQKKLTHELEMSLHKANLAQLKVNETEAAHKSMFVAGWRPFVAYLCFTIFYFLHLWCLYLLLQVQKLFYQRLSFHNLVVF